MLGALQEEVCGGGEGISVQCERERSLGGEQAGRGDLPRGQHDKGGEARGEEAAP